MRLSLSAVLATAALDAMGVALTLPILPALLRQVGHDGAPGWRYGGFLALYALMQFLLSPTLGALSDRHGRRPVLLLSLLGQCASYLLLALAPNFTLLMLGRALAGATGATGAVAAAYLADVTPPAGRARRFGQLGACVGLGYIAGPALGGALGEHGVRLPFLAAAALALVNAAWTASVLRESRQHLRDEAPTPAMPPASEATPMTSATGHLAGPAACADAQPAAGLDRTMHVAHHPLDPLGPLRWGWRTPGLPPLLGIYAIFALVAEIGGTVWVPYGEDRFGWSPWSVGVSLACFGACHALVQACLTGPLAERWGERRTLLLGAAADASAYLLIAIASQGWMAFALLPLFCVGGLAAPALQSLLSASVDGAHQGRLQGLLASTAGLVSVGGPLTISVLYFASRHRMPGLVWCVGAALYGLGLPLALLALRSRSARSTHPPRATPPTGQA
ncbi:TCR/Tet family MFS transporter [Chitinasiproducens palmae]|uniref:MFS transporter, DHA1 family, tetracycline resistance protein n=1 Tax=Chitinasiproducens palmae TaxID=1770053 RepID=A0A1H2PPR8_9BURK|nr:TCR/Tet family MFS transporter [Chitinasiproducens palmae]SDV48766.1 MFS transporter, DHA1 family, tetracycline resistance protein [Chitinasiproducens palmae]